MDENKSETAEPQEADAMTTTQKSVQFINAEVLSPPAADPLGGIAKLMIEQSTGMMVQDLQSFLKSFEQLGLIAISRLANNLLTYGTWSENKPPPGDTLSAENYNHLQGNEMIRDLFNIVSDYADAKAKISSTIYHPAVLNTANPTVVQNANARSDDLKTADDNEKKTSNRRGFYTEG